MRRTSIARLVLLALAVSAPGVAFAGPLNPLAFTPIGPFPTAAGDYIFDTSWPNPTLTGPDGAALTGVVSNGIAVFTFSSITVSHDQTFAGPPLGPFGPLAGSPSQPSGLPLALLSQSSIVINGTVDVSAPSIGHLDLYPGGVGGFGSDGGPGRGGPGDENPATPYRADYAGGGGFGGAGGSGGRIEIGPNLPIGGKFTAFAAHNGGGGYGNLAALLQGGSGGGTYEPRGKPFPGGGGGGAIELGAVGGITVGGGILANGSPGAGGGGSGGGIFLHGDSLALLSSGVLSATGGPGDAGGGGGGGRVLIQVAPGGYTGLGTIDVSGAPGGPSPVEPFNGAGARGVVTLSIVPEPSGLLLLGTGAVGLLAFGARRARTRA